MNSPEDIIREALREYVGDGEGEDEEVLRQYSREIWQDGFESFRNHIAEATFDARTKNPFLYDSED